MFSLTNRNKTVIKNQTYTRDSVITQVETAGWLLVPTSCPKQVQYEQVVQEFVEF